MEACQLEVLAGYQVHSATSSGGIWKILWKSPHGFGRRGILTDLVFYHCIIIQAWDEG